MPRCRSVIIFGRPFVGHIPYVVGDKHIAEDAWWEANKIVFRDLAIWRGDIINLLDEFGLATTNIGGHGPTSEPTFSYRLAQHEAGVGVYGRFGVCLNLEFGCYYKVSALLTDADLSPSNKLKVKNFSPCLNCTSCAEVCPVRAIDPSLHPAEGYNRDLCTRFILKMKERHGHETKICARCFSVCPWGWHRNRHRGEKCHLKQH